MEVLAQISGSPGADFSDIIGQVENVTATSHLVTPTAPEPQLTPPPKAALARPERGNAHTHGIWCAPTDEAKDRLAREENWIGRLRRNEVRAETPPVVAGAR